VENPIAMTNPSLAPAPVQRILSLDILRGITIAFMIMVNNNGGSGSWGFMRHAEWNGMTATDLVFPSFVFVVGASIAFAFEARLVRGATRAQLAWHTVKRAVKLFLLGLLINAFPSFELAHLRIYGVLQRIALCYLIVGLFYLWDRRVWTKVAALVAALLGYWILLRWVPVPGAGMPGRDIPFMDQSLNLVAWIDRHLMPHHLYLNWPGPGVSDPFDLRDPEGLLSTLPALGTTLLGLLTGLWLRAKKPVETKSLGLAAGAALCLTTGYLWSIYFPLNKNLWTSSFVLVAAGWSLAVLALVFWAADVRGWRKRWTWPWLVLGSNAITAYIFSELVPNALDNTHFLYHGKRTDLLSWVFTHFFAHIPNPGWAAFSYSVATLAYCFIPVWLLYRRKIFLKV
jgi:predicted acyltransferase